MSTETLNIVITGNNKQLIAAVNQSDVAIDKFANSATKASSAVNTAGAAVGKNNQKWLEFGRVIQDLPYGFTGIANNLTQLIPAVGGIGLAFSAVVSAITFAQIGFSNWTRGMGAAKKETEEFTKSVEQAASSAAKDGLMLQAYVSIAKDHTKSLEERNNALKKANELYGDHGEKLTLINIETEHVTASINGYTEALIKNAIVQKYGDKLADAYIKQRDAIMKVEAAEKALQNFRNRGSANGQLTGEIQITSIVDTKETIKDETRLVKELVAAKKELPAVQAAYNSELEYFNKLMSDVNATDAKFGEHKKEKQDALNDFEKLNIVIGLMVEKREGLALLAKQIYNLYSTIAEDVGSDVVGKKMQLAPVILPQRPELISPTEPFAGKDNAKKFIDAEHGINQTNDSLKAYNDLVKEAMQTTNALAQPFTDLANAMLQGQNLGEALGNVFKKLAADIAAAAIKAAIFSVILNSLTGGTSGGLGAILGGGNSFGALFGKFLGFDTGGTAKGPKSGYPVMLHGTESIFRPDQLGSTLSMAMKAGAMSGGSPQPIVLDTRISGNDIYLSQRRTDFFRNLRT